VSSFFTFFLAVVVVDSSFCVDDNDTTVVEVSTAAEVTVELSAVEDDAIAEVVVDVSAVVAVVVSGGFFFFFRRFFSFFSSPPPAGVVSSADESSDCLSSSFFIVSFVSLLSCTIKYFLNITTHVKKRPHYPRKKALFFISGFAKILSYFGPLSKLSRGVQKQQTNSTVFKLIFLLFFTYCILTRCHALKPYQNHAQIRDLIWFSKEHQNLD
jgi:hypothetical protein